MDPERAERRRQWPSLSIVFQTRDRGRTWTQSTSSMFGRIIRMRMGPNGQGLLLVWFDDGFEWPSEVYRYDVAANTTTRTFREQNRAVTDALLVGGSAYLAAFEPPGKLRHSPIPGRLVILKSDDLSNWSEMPVDYRAITRRAILTAAGLDHIWVAADTGMILKLAAD